MNNCPRNENEGRGPDCPDHPRPEGPSERTWRIVDWTLGLIAAGCVAVAVFGGFK